MSATAAPETLTLAAAYDDPERPTELTAYPPDADCWRTCWITIDVEHAVPLDQAR